MIAKIGKGDNFRRLQKYLTHDNRGSVLEMRGLSAEEPEDAAAEMEIAASQSRRVKNPVMHISVSYSTDDPAPTDQQMRSDAAEVLESLGLEKNQAVVIRHHDAAHPHFHIMVNRIGLDGKAVSDSRSFARAEAALRRIEAKRGLRPVVGRNAASPTTGQRMAGQRTSRDPRQHEAPLEVRGALVEAKSWPDLKAGLARHGWRLEIIQKRPGQRAGAVLVGPQGQRIAPGRIDRAASLPALRKRLDGPSQARPGQPNEAAGIAAAPRPTGAGMRPGASLAKLPGAAGKGRLAGKSKKKAAVMTAIKIAADVMTGGSAAAGAALGKMGRKRQFSRRGATSRLTRPRGPGLGM